MNTHTNKWLWLAFGSLAGALIVQIIGGASRQVQINGLEDQVIVLVALVDQMVETDKALAEAVETNAESILMISGATTSNSESAWALFEYAQTLSEKVTHDIAEIYQGHIIPLRTFHMEPLTDN